MLSRLGAEPTSVKVDASDTLELDHGYTQVNVKASPGVVHRYAIRRSAQ